MKQELHPKMCPVIQCVVHTNILVHFHEKVSQMEHDTWQTNMWLQILSPAKLSGNLCL